MTAIGVQFVGNTQEIPELKKLLDEAKIILKQCSPLPQQEIDASELAAVDTSESPTPFAKKKKKKKKQASRSRHVTTAADDHLSDQEADKQFAATEMTVAVTTMKASLFNNPDDTDDPSQAALLHSRPNVI